MPIGFPGMQSQGSRGSNSGFGNLLGYGGNAPGVDTDDINALLQQYGGINLPGSGPTGLFERTGLENNHPRLAYGLDNALIALGNMGPTGPTIGDNISNVARGLQSIGPTRQGQQMAPTVMALQMAQQVAALKGASAYQGREQAMANYYNDRTSAQRDVADTNAASRLQVAQSKNAMLAGKEGMVLADGTVGLPEVGDDGNIKYTSHPEIDAKAFQKAQNRKQLQGIMGNSTEGSIIQGMLGDDPDSYASKTGKGRQAYFKDANSIMLQHKTAAAGVGVGGAQNRLDQSEWATNQQKQFSQISSGPGTAAIREKRVDSRAQEIFMGSQGKIGLSDARKQAEQEQTAHQGKLMNAWGQFSLLSPDQQKNAGGINGYLQQQGYDVNSDTFSTPRTGAQPQTPPPSASPMPGMSIKDSTKATGQGGATGQAQARTPQTSLSPNVQAIIDSLNGKPQ